MASAASDAESSTRKPPTGLDNSSSGVYVTRAVPRRLEEKRALASDAAHAERLKALLAKVRQKHENSEPTKEKRKRKVVDYLEYASGESENDLSEADDGEEGIQLDPDESDTKINREEQLRQKDAPPDKIYGTFVDDDDGGMVDRLSVEGDDDCSPVAGADDEYVPSDEDIDSLAASALEYELSELDDEDEDEYLNPDNLTLS